MDESLMDKTKISKKQASSSKKNKTNKLEEGIFVLKKGSQLKEYDPVKNLLDINRMGAAIMQCLIENDSDGALEIVEAYLYALNKTQFLKKAEIPRSTAYNFMKRRNPTIKTLAKIMHASAHL